MSVCLLKDETLFATYSTCHIRKIYHTNNHARHSHMATCVILGITVK